MMCSRVRFFCALVVAAFLHMSQSFAQSVYDILDQGGDCIARSVSDDGRVVGLTVQMRPGGMIMSDEPESKLHLPAIWRDGDLIPLDTAMLAPASIKSLSADGRVAAGAVRSTTKTTTVVRWVNQVPELVAVPQSVSTYSAQVSADGSTIVGSATIADEGSTMVESAFILDTSTVFVWRGDRIELLSEPGSVTEVSADGEVVVGFNFENDGVVQAIVWDRGRFYKPLEGVRYSAAMGVSNDGKSILVEYGKSYPHRNGVGDGLKLFRGQRAIDILPLGEIRPLNAIISGDGKVIVITLVGRGKLTTAREVGVWREVNGWKRESLADLLNETGVALPDWELRVPTGLSFDGSVIVGNGQYKGRFAAWRLDLTPGGGTPIQPLCP